jgi:hypothetical protein
VIQEDDSDFVIEEFRNAELGDARLPKRLVALARRFEKSPNCSIPQSLSSAQLKVVYRFFDNE